MLPAASKCFELALQQHEIALQPRILDGKYRIDLGRRCAGEILVCLSLDVRRRDVDVHYLADATPDPFTGLVSRTEGQRAVLRGCPDAATIDEFGDRGRSSNVIHQRVLPNTTSVALCEAGRCHLAAMTSRFRPCTT